METAQRQRSAAPVKNLNLYEHSNCRCIPSTSRSLGQGRWLWRFVRHNAANSTNRLNLCADLPRDGPRSPGRRRARALRQRSDESTVDVPRAHRMRRRLESDDNRHDGPRRLVSRDRPKPQQSRRQPSNPRALRVARRRVRGRSGNRPTLPAGRKRPQKLVLPNASLARWVFAEQYDMRIS